MVKVGIVGFGKMGLLHASILNAFEDTKVVAVAEPLKFIRSGLGQFHPNLKLYRDYKNMLNECELDLVVITTPISSHVSIAKECIRHKCHVFIEKPLAMNTSECHELERVLGDNPDVRCVVGYCLRYRCTFQKAKELLEESALGSLISFQATMYSSDVCKRSTGWRFNRKKSGGGVTIELGSHLINLLVWYFGLPEKLTAATKKWYSAQVEDQVHAHIWMRDGIAGWMDCSWSAPNYRVPFTKIHLFGEDGEAIVTNDEIRLWLKKKKAQLPVSWSNQYAVDLKPDVEFEISEEYYTLQLRETINYCKGERDHLNNIASGSSTQACIDAIYQSAKENMPVNLDSFSNKRGN